MASIHGFSIKNRKSFQGRDWEGNQGDICYEGKKVGWYNNDGNGGCADIDFYAAGERRDECEQLLKQAVEKYYKANPMTGEFEDLIPDSELFMCELLTLIDREKSYKQMVKKGYPVTIMYSDDGYNENILGCKTIEYAQKHIADKGITNATTYTSLADFIVK